MAKDQGPPTWQDALSSASQAISAGLVAPDADVKFGLALIGAIATHGKRVQGSGAGGAAGPGGPAGGGSSIAGSPPPGGPPTDGGGAPPGVSGAPGPPGGGAPNSAMASNAAPGGPIPGGMSPGLSPNPDELRRVLADVAGK